MARNNLTLLPGISCPPRNDYFIASKAGARLWTTNNNLHYISYLF